MIVGKGITDPKTMVDTMLAHGFNTKDPVGYKRDFLNIFSHMAGHMADCGVKQ